MNIKRLAGCFFTLATILALVILSGANFTGESAAAEETPVPPTTSPTPEVFLVELRPTPTPTEDPDAPTAPPSTPRLVLVITDYQNDPQEVSTAASSAYYSPFEVLYWKFVLWSTQYNRTICPSKIDGFYRYARNYVDVSTDRDEYPFWSSKVPKSTRGKDLMRLNVIAADLFFDYIKSTAACGSKPVVPYEGVVLEFIRDKDGMNRSARVYDLNGKCLDIMSEAEFNDTIGREYSRRLNGTN